MLVATLGGGGGTSVGGTLGAAGCGGSVGCASTGLGGRTVGVAATADGDGWRVAEGEAGARVDVGVADLLLPPHADSAAASRATHTARGTAIRGFMTGLLSR
ncbi:MAG: hypothetical protein M3P30_00005 [Chloroflexota bacterium]|nr:hypothetical protein [Chloroflexota bacterium]